MALFLRFSLLIDSDQEPFCTSDPMQRAPKRLSCFAESGGVFGRFGRWVMAPHSQGGAGWWDIVRGHPGASAVPGAAPSPQEEVTAGRMRKEEGAASQEVQTNGWFHLRASADPVLHPALSKRYSASPLVLFVATTCPLQQGRPGISALIREMIHHSFLCKLQTTFGGLLPSQRRWGWVLREPAAAEAIYLIHKYLCNSSFFFLKRYLRRHWPGALGSKIVLKRGKKGYIQRGNPTEMWVLVYTFAPSAENQKRERRKLFRAPGLTMSKGQRQDVKLTGKFNSWEEKK